MGDDTPSLIGSLGATTVTSLARPVANTAEDEGHWWYGAEEALPHRVSDPSDLGRKKFEGTLVSLQGPDVARFINMVYVYYIASGNRKVLPIDIFNHFAKDVKAQVQNIPSFSSCSTTFDYIRALTKFHVSQAPTPATALQNLRPLAPAESDNPTDLEVQVGVWKTQIVERLRSYPPDVRTTKQRDAVRVILNSLPASTSLTCWRTAPLHTR